MLYNGQAGTPILLSRMHSQTHFTPILQVKAFRGLVQFD